MSIRRSWTATAGCGAIAMALVACAFVVFRGTVAIPTVGGNGGLHHGGQGEILVTPGRGNVEALPPGDEAEVQVTVSGATADSELSVTCHEVGRGRLWQRTGSPSGVFRGPARVGAQVVIGIDEPYTLALHRKLIVEAGTNLVRIDCAQVPLVEFVLPVVSGLARSDAGALLYQVTSLRRGSPDQTPARVARADRDGLLRFRADVGTILSITVGNRYGESFAVVDADSGARAFEVLRSQRFVTQLEPGVSMVGVSEPNGPLAGYSEQAGPFLANRSFVFVRSSDLGRGGLVLANVSGWVTVTQKELSGAAVARVRPSRPWLTLDARVSGASLNGAGEIVLTGPEQASQPLSETLIRAIGARLLVKRRPVAQRIRFRHLVPGVYSAWWKALPTAKPVLLDRVRVQPGENHCRLEVSGQAPVTAIVAGLRLGQEFLGESQIFVAGKLVRNGEADVRLTPHEAGSLPSEVEVWGKSLVVSSVPISRWESTTPPRGDVGPSVSLVTIRVAAQLGGEVRARSTHWRRIGFSAAIEADADGRLRVLAVKGRASEIEIWESCAGQKWFRGHVVVSPSSSRDHVTSSLGGRWVTVRSAGKTGIVDLLLGSGGRSVRLRAMAVGAEERVWVPNEVTWIALADSTRELARASIAPEDGLIEFPNL